MASLVNILDKKFRNFLSSKKYHNELLGHPTINIGIINGGTRTNIVADRCTVEIDLRLTPELSTHEAYEALNELLQNMASLK